MYPFLFLGISDWNFLNPRDIFASTEIHNPFQLILFKSTLDFLEHSLTIHLEVMAAPQVSIPHLRLLSLDGGGVRGLASLIVLKKLLAMVGAPKPCQFFDMICGTSTGG